MIAVMGLYKSLGLQKYPIKDMKEAICMKKKLDVDR